MSGCPQEADRWSCHGSRAVTWAGSFVAPPLCQFFLSIFYIFWIADLRCVYLSLSHRCFVSLHFWGICKPSEKSELTPISQWDSLHASLLLNCVPFIYVGYEHLSDMTIANMFCISYFISHFIDVSPWRGFRVWYTHTCSLFLSLLLLELHQNLIAKADVQEHSTPSFLGAK